MQPVEPEFEGKMNVTVAGRISRATPTTTMHGLFTKEEQFISGGFASPGREIRFTRDRGIVSGGLAAAGYAGSRTSW